MKTFTRSCRIAIGSLFIVAASNVANADWHQFWHQFHVDYHRANAWPDPFNEVDSLEVVRPFEIMKNNGWRLHNTIGHELFRDGDGALLSSGSERVHWIATQAPESRRAVFVLRGKSERETQARVASVRETLASIYMVGSTPEIILTEQEPSTASGQWATQINRDWMEVLPKPKLPRRSAQGDDSTAEQ